MAGTPLKLTVAGKSYTVERPTVATLARIEDAIADEAFGEAEHMLATATTPRAKARAEKAISYCNSSVIEERAHKVGNRWWNKAMTDPKQLGTLLLWSCLVPAAPDLDLKTVLRMLTVSDAGSNAPRILSEITSFFVEALSESVGIPVGILRAKGEEAMKQQSPTEPSLGTPSSTESQP